MTKTIQKTKSAKIKDYVSIIIGVSCIAFIDYSFIMFIFFDLKLEDFLFRLFMGVMVFASYFVLAYGE